MTIYQPYTYLIGWSQFNKWYYGVRTAKFANPGDLWASYFTSSKFVKQFRKQFGEPDIVEVRKIFSSGKEALIWEQKVLTRLDVAESEIWLNKHNGGKNFSTFGKTWEEMLGEEKAAHMRIIRKNQPRNFKGLPGEKNPMYGKTHTDETKAEFSKKRANVSYEDYMGLEKSLQKRKNHSERMTGENHPLYGKKRPTAACPHCNKFGWEFNMKRYHFENCKVLR